MALKKGRKRGRRKRGGVTIEIHLSPTPFFLGAQWRVAARSKQPGGRLDGIAGVLPDTQLLLYQYVRKETVLSSQIEGT